jgi:hypothetical protein
MISKLFESVLCIALSPLLVAQQASEAPAGLEGALVPAPGPKAFLPKHTEIRLILMETISSATASKGQSVRMAVGQDVSINGVVVIRKGTPAIGVIDFVRRAVPGKKNGEVSIKPMSISLPNSRPITLRPYNGSEQDALGEALFPILPFCYVVMLVAIPFHRKHETGEEFVLGTCSEQWSELPHAVTIVSSGATGFEPAAAAQSETDLSATCANLPASTFP